MANMSYCRFQNTLSDFRDCARNFFEDELSVEEHNARRKLLLEMIELFDNLGAPVSEEDIDPTFLEKKDGK